MTSPKTTPPGGTLPRQDYAGWPKSTPVRLATAILFSLLIAGCTTPVATETPAKPLPTLVSAIRPNSEVIGGSPVGVVVNSTFYEMDQNRMRVWYTLQNVGNSNRYVTGVDVVAKNAAGEALAGSPVGSNSVTYGATTAFLKPGQVAGAWSDIYLEPGQYGETRSFQFNVASEAPYGKIAQDWSGRWTSRLVRERWVADAFEATVEVSNGAPSWRGIRVTLVTYDAQGNAVGIGEASGSAYANASDTVPIGEVDSAPNLDYHYEGANSKRSPVAYSLEFDYPR